MSKLLLIAFEANEAAQGAGFAHALGMPFDMLCLTGNAATDLGATRVLQANLPEVPAADALASALASQTSGYSHVAAVSSMRSKDVMARLAGLMDAAMVTDVVGIKSSSVFKRPIVAGSIVATVEVLAEPVVLTFRPAGFPAPASEGTSEVENVSLSLSGRTRRTASSARGGGRPDLSQAKVVVSGGRPLKDAETFERVLGGLADKLGGAVAPPLDYLDSQTLPHQPRVGAAKHFRGRVPENGFTSVVEPGSVQPELAAEIEEIDERFAAFSDRDAANLAYWLSFRGRASQAIGSYAPTFDVNSGTASNRSATRP